MLDKYHDLYEALNKDIRPMVVPELDKKYGRGASYGWDGSTCPNEHQRKAIAMSYGIYRQILHFFSLQRKDNEWDVHKSPTLTCDEQGGLIKIQEIK